MSKRKPHNQDAGYICELIFKPSHSHIVIYRAAEQNFEQDEKYLVVCSKHGTNVPDTNIPSARKSMKFPAFCEECMAIEDASCDREVNRFLDNESKRPHIAPV